MREIRKLEQNQLSEALRIAAKSYPMLDITTTDKLAELEKSILETFQSPGRTWYGLFEDGAQIGNMVVYDYVLHYYHHNLPARGIGFVAVDLLHKKRKVARDMLHWFLEDTRKRKIPMAMLYSFRPDFYQKMGFGYGTFCHNYTLTPAQIPDTASDLVPEYLTVAHAQEVHSFFENLYRQHHGMIEKKLPALEAMLKAPGFHHVAFREQGRMTALLSMKLTANDSTNDRTHLHGIPLFLNGKGLDAILHFLHSQADQVSTIHISTQYRGLFHRWSDIRHLDQKILQQPGFHHLYDTGMGLMYRSLDAARLLTMRPCQVDHLTVEIILQDDFIPAENRQFLVEWNQGGANISRKRKADVTLKMDVATFSSWVMNAADIGTLIALGKVLISDETMTGVLKRAFAGEEEPICLEKF